MPKTSPFRASIQLTVLAILIGLSTVFMGWTIGDTIFMGVAMILALIDPTHPKSYPHIVQRKALQVPPATDSHKLFFLVLFTIALLAVLMGPMTFVTFGAALWAASVVGAMFLTKITGVSYPWFYDGLIGRFAESGASPETIESLQDVAALTALTLVSLLLGLALAWVQAVFARKIYGAQPSRQQRRLSVAVHALFVATLPFSLLGPSWPTYLCFIAVCVLQHLMNKRAALVANAAPGAPQSS